jgi:xylitol oxidase
MVELTNWAGNLRYRAQRLLEPESVEEVQEIVRASRALRVLGSRHSFNDIADSTGDLLSMSRLPRMFELDRERSAVTVDGAVTYGQLCARLDGAGYALHNLASLPHISVAGACATGTHGSGDQKGNLATAVSALEVVIADGEIRTFRRGDTDFPGAPVSLGALGVVVRITLDLVPSFRARQDVYERLPLATAVDHFDEVTAAADSVSLFTTWREPIFDQVWLKRSVSATDRFEAPAHLFGAPRATIELHPIRGLPTEPCTPQLGVVGPWLERMPHFLLGFTPSAGDELQSEYFVPRRHAAEGLLAIDRVGREVASVLQVSEIRTIAADELWMSTANGEDSVAFHFTWVPDWPAVRAVLPTLEAALAPFGPRPHWGKLFTIGSDAVRSRYPQLPAFSALVQRCDPEGKLRNAFLERHLFGPG